MTSITRIATTPLWSDAVIHNGTAYFVEVAASGEDFRSQTLAIFSQAQARLALCASDVSRLLMVTIYLKDMKNRALFNELWQAWIPPGTAPARACIRADLASEDYLLELVFTAAV